MNLLRTRRPRLPLFHANVPPRPARARAGRLTGAWIAIILGAVAQAPVAAQGTGRSGHLLPGREVFAAQKMMKLPAPPVWDASLPADTWTVEQIQAEFAKITDTPPHVNFVHSRFLRPDHAWLTRFKGWFRDLRKPLKMHFEEELWDCDNYANCFVMFADLLTLKSGEMRGALCVGWATVHYQRPFAGISDSVHAVAIVGTSEGLFVIEPQDGTMVPLRGFPNRHTIETVYF